MSEAACARRVIGGLKQLDGITFAARIMVDTSDNPNYRDSNKIANVVLPNESAYAAIMRGETQASIRRDDTRGRIISGAEPGWSVHLFLRKSKLRDGRAAPFRYAGPVSFAGWEGEAPMTVQWDMAEPVPKHLRALYGVEQ